MQENNFPEQDELVLCTVDRILGTTVFVRIDRYNNREGVIATSEIAPGRIRNIRDYVRPNKKIVCKVLRIHQETNHIDLSLRRVSLKEREGILSEFEKERNMLAVMRTILKEKTDEIKDKINKNHGNIIEFFQKATAGDLKEVGLNETEIEQFLKIAKERPQRKVSIKAKLIITSDAEDGITRIKQMLLKILQKYDEADIIYISSTNYTLTITAADYKAANKKTDNITEDLSNEAKNNGCKIEVQR